MPRKRRTPKPDLRAKPQAEPTLFIGCFSFDQPGEPDHDGSFQMVVEAGSPEEADDKCRRQLKRLRTTATLFDDPITIYMTGFVELKASFKEGLLINYESGRAPPPPNVRIGCLLPGQDDHKAESYNYEPDGPLKEGQKGETKPFVDFGGFRFRDALRKRSPTRSDEVAGWDASGSPQSASADQAEHREREAAQATRAVARSAAQAKRERRAALESTLAELREAKGNVRRPRPPSQG